MLTGSEVNPFDSQETKPYKNDSQIKAMTDLVDAYQRREVHLAEKILRGEVLHISEALCSTWRQIIGQRLWMTSLLDHISVNFYAVYAHPT
jgi:hypothetical protein